MTDVVAGAQELTKEAGATLTVAKTFKVTTTAEYNDAGAKLQGIKGLMKQLDEIFDKHIKKAFDAHRGLVAEKKTQQALLLEAEGIIKRTMLGYQQEQERIRREAEAKAQEEARKEREKLEARAAAAEAKGKTERAEALQQQADAVVTPIIAPTTPKVAGISTRVTYKAVVRDLDALIAAVAAKKVPRMALLANDTYLGQQARANKGTLDYPGVEVVEESSIASRSA